MAGMVKRIVEGKNYEEIEKCLNLFTVIAEERAFMERNGINDPLDT